jgi:hypothetical protein
LRSAGLDELGREEREARKEHRLLLDARVCGREAVEEFVTTFKNGFPICDRFCTNFATHAGTDPLWYSYLCDECMKDMLPLHWSVVATYVPLAVTSLGSIDLACNVSTPPASVNAGRACPCGIARQDCEYHR